MEIALKLAMTLSEILKIDPSLHEVKNEEERQKRYAKRNELIHDAVFYARKVGYKAGYVIHEPVTDLVPVVIHEDGVIVRNADGFGECEDPVWDTRMGVVSIIELPTGQVSWHMDSGDLKYDGHDNTDKCVRAALTVAKLYKDLGI